MVITPQLKSQLRNAVTMPKCVLKWEGPQPYIYHNKKIHKAKQMVIHGTTYYKVVAQSTTWLIIIA